VLLLFKRRGRGRGRCRRHPLVRQHSSYPCKRHPRPIGSPPAVLPPPPPLTAKRKRKASGWMMRTGSRGDAFRQYNDDRGCARELLPPLMPAPLVEDRT
jgi:hypothetical protein